MPFGKRQYAYNRLHNLTNSFFMFFKNCFLLTGSVEKMFFNITLVPCCLGITS